MLIKVAGTAERPVVMPLKCKQCGKSIRRDRGGERCVKCIKGSR